MFLSKKSQAVPFIDIVYFLNRDIFVEQGLQSFVASKFESRINGHAYNFNVDNVLKAAIGEWSERYTLLNNRYTEDEKLLSFNLTDGKIQKTNA
ncbi:hypothetical protein [Virgibacillus kimchii]